MTNPHKLEAILDLSDVLCGMIDNGPLAIAFGTGLAGPKGPEPPPRLGASHGIPIAEKRRG